MPMNILSAFKDWNSQLRLNAAACMLAPSIYDRSKERQGFRGPEFERLPPGRRDHYIALAVSVLEADRSEQPMDVSVMSAAARAYITGLGSINRRKVIGQIGTGAQS